MEITEIVAIVASIITIIAFLFNVWQHVRLKSAKQALESIRSISQAAFVEADQLQKQAKSEEERAHYRTLAAFLVSIINASLAFLQVSRRQISEPSDREQAFLFMDELTQDISLNKENWSVKQSAEADADKSRR